MKSLLWLALSVALVVNVVSNVVLDGMAHVLTNVTTGALVLAAAAGLYAARDRRQHA
ncbi:hypothetical protein NKH77_25515 [Streptomyces sp. M19]